MKTSLLQTTKCNIILALRNYHDINLSMALYKAGKAVIDNLYNVEIRNNIINEVAEHYGVSFQEIESYLATGKITFITEIQNRINQERLERFNNENFN